MKINYFQDTDTLYIEPHPAEVSETKDLDENTILDLDAGGNICSMTIEHATSRADIPHFSRVPSSSAPLSLQVKPGLEKYMIRLLATLFFCSLLSTNVAAASPKPGDIAPEFKLQDLSGKQHTLADLRAKGPVLLFFWSTECGFCRVIAPKLQKLYLERAASGLTVAGIDIDFKMREQVEAFVRERNLTFLILHGSLDNADAVEAYGVPGTPTLVVVGRDGRVVYYGHSLDDAARRIP